MNNPFVLPPEEYKRDLNILGHYLKDSATYLNLMSGKPMEECLQFVKTELRPGGKFEFKDPAIRYLNRGDNGDRALTEGTLLKYINESIKEKELIVSTFTTYLNPEVKKSLLVDFIDGNVTARGVAKKAMFAAKIAGDKFMEAFKKGEQTGKKLNNNAISGAHVSNSTPLYNKTGHSTLTSNCRSTSGYGNANNEKFLSGNRHYWSPDIVKNNIISIINNTDYTLLEKAMGHYGIRHPSVEETVEVIKFSTQLYWTASIDFEKLVALVSKLSDIQRSAFVYTGDLYHLMKFNDEVVRKFITKISTRVDKQHHDPDSVLVDVMDDVKHLASQICSGEVKGTTVRDIKGTPAYGIYCSTVENIVNTLNEYELLIKAFWVTKNVPASVAYFPESIRRSAITSDTDSTIFTVQDWVIWHRGKLEFSLEATGVSASLIFLASQTITHVLARMSANFGIETKRIHQIAMKNEFKFDVFVPTQVAKHYYAFISCQEGNVFSTFEEEIKGVHLKSSNAPKKIMAEAKKMMLFIMQSVIDGKKLSVNHLMTWVADIERDVADSVRKASHEYFRKGQIKSPDSYKDGEQASPYMQYLLWKDVFAPTYGESPKPPYMSIKISADLSSPGKTKLWLDGLKDQVLADRARTWMAKHDKTHLGSTFMLPEQCLVSTGIPPELLEIVDVRRIIIDCVKVFYIILESLGIFMLTDKNNRLCSDTH
jgi:hypothetical protein